MKKATILFLLILGFLALANCAPKEKLDPTPVDDGETIKLLGNHRYPLTAITPKTWPDIGTGKVVLKLGVTCKGIFHGLNGVEDISGDWNVAEWVKEDLGNYELEIKLDEYQTSFIYLYAEGVDYEVPGNYEKYHTIEFNAHLKPEEE